MKKIVVFLGVVAVILMVILSAGCTGSSSSGPASTSNPQVSPTVPTPAATVPTPVATSSNVFLSAIKQPTDGHEYDIVGTWKASVDQRDQTNGAATFVFNNNHSFDSWDGFGTVWAYLGNGMYITNSTCEMGSYYLSSDGSLTMGGGGYFEKQSGKDGSIVGRWKLYPTASNNGKTARSSGGILELKDDGSITAQGLTIFDFNGKNDAAHWEGSGKTGEINYVYYEEYYGRSPYCLLIANNNYLLDLFPEGDSFPKYYKQ